MMRCCFALFRIFLVVLALAAPIAAAEIPQKATPAFWVVEKDGRTLYLFGSVHLLQPDIKWTRDEIERARARSAVFAFEAPLKDAEVAMARFVEAHGRLPQGKTLKDILQPDLFEDLEKAAWAVQYPPKLLAPLRPWLAAVYLELYAYLKAGYSPFYGVDHIIEREAQARGAQFAYFETVEEQLSFFAKLTGDGELNYLKATVRGVLDEPNLPADLIKAWATGNTVSLAAMIEKGFEDVPQLRAQLLVARNRNWLPRIIDMLKSGKIHFVTVGAGHLSGKDSVVAMLRARGYRVTGP